MEQQTIDKAEVFAHTFLKVVFKNSHWLLNEWLDKSDSKVGEVFSIVYREIDRAMVVLQKMDEETDELIREQKKAREMREVQKEAGVAN